MSDPLAFACRAVGCKKPVDVPCVYTSGAKKGKPCGPHPLRVALADGASSRDGEVSRLNVAWKAAEASVDTFAEMLGEAQDTATTLTAALDAEHAKFVRANDEGVRAEIERDLVTRERDALQARLDALEPEPTRMLIGSGGGNTDRTKEPIDIDRPYYGGSDADLDKFVAAASKNHAAGILTWATFKLPVSWAPAAAGGADAWFDRLIAKADLGFEVWIDLHHEPEGDGDGRLWRQFQGRLANRLGDGATGPVKFLLCMTGYSEEYGGDPATKWETYWPSEAADKIYAIAYDNPYLRYGKDLKTGVLDTTWSEGEVSYVKKLAARAKSLGVKAAIGEMGYSDEAFTKDPAWLDRTFAACAAEGIVAVVYFDSILNSTRSWALGPARSAKRYRFETAAAANR